VKAAQFNKYGGPEVVEFKRDAVLPKAGEGQILVEAGAASINPIDLLVRAGYLQGMIPLTFPVTLLGDFAGEVKEVGQGVSGLRVGDQVLGFAPVIAGGSGAAAEYVVAKASMAARRPASASHTEAAALPLTGSSALQALENHMKVKPGQKILVHGGAGGIGSFAIQHAKHLGCHVATTVRGSQKEFVRRLGADDIIDFELEEFDAVLKEYDGVLDTVGGDVYKRSFSVLKRGGILASMVQNSPDQELMSKFGVTSVYVLTRVDSASLNKLAELVDKGALRPQIDREFPLEQAREACAYFEQDHPKGKVVVRIK
jgi:NADPH:quinone reductase-like Zn-dependent oxidoreductase